MFCLFSCSLLGRVLLIQARFVEHLIWLEYFWITPYLVLSDYHLFTKYVETSNLGRKHFPDNMENTNRRENRLQEVELYDTGVKNSFHKL